MKGEGWKAAQGILIFKDYKYIYIEIYIAKGRDEK